MRAIECCLGPFIAGNAFPQPTFVPTRVQQLDTFDTRWRLTVFRGTTVVVAHGNPSVCGMFDWFEFNAAWDFGSRAAIPDA